MTFSNNSSQKERAAILKNETRLRQEQATTLHQFATSASDEAGGRFAQVNKSNVIGSSPVSYPTLKSGPWSAQPGPGPEPPYPIDLSEPPEPVGTAQEIEDSLQPFSWLRRDGVSTSASGAASSPPDVVAMPPATAVSSSSPLGTPRPADEDLGEVPHVVEEGGVTTNRDGEGAPSSKNSKTKRRLV